MAARPSTSARQAPAEARAECAAERQVLLETNVGHGGPWDARRHILPASPAAGCSASRRTTRPTAPPGPAGRSVSVRVIIERTGGVRALPAQCGVRSCRMRVWAFCSSCPKTAPRTRAPASRSSAATIARIPFAHIAMRRAQIDGERQACVGTVGSATSKAKATRAPTPLRCAPAGCNRWVAAALSHCRHSCA
jgi:hypothetical protein